MNGMQVLLHAESLELRGVAYPEVVESLVPTFRVWSPVQFLFSCIPGMDAT